MGTPLTEVSSAQVELCPGVQDRLASVMKQAIRQHHADDERLRAVLGDCVAEAKQAGLPPEVILGALKRMLETNGLAALAPLEHAQLTRRIVGWFLDAFYG